MFASALRPPLKLPARLIEVDAPDERDDPVVAEGLGALTLTPMRTHRSGVTSHLTSDGWKHYKHERDETCA